MATLAAGTGGWGELQSGDLVLFASESPSWSWRRLLGRPCWAHVGLVLRQPEDAEPLLWESVPRRGALRQSPLAEHLGHFRGRVSARRLSQRLSPALHARFDAVRRELTARERERGLLDLMAAGEDGWLGASTENLGAPAAGELVALAYQRLGLLDGPDRGGPRPSHFTPRHFAESARLQLNLGYALGPELPLSAPDEVASPGYLTPHPA